MSEEVIKYLEARVEALETELKNKIDELKKAHEFMEKLAKEMEVDYEKL